MSTEKCTEKRTENYWACQCPGYAAVQAKRTIACPVCGGRNAGWKRVTVNMINTAIAEAGNAYVEALSTDQPIHVTSALYLRWWSLEHPVATWPEAPRPSAPKFEWREIASFEGYETSGPWGKAYVFYRRGLDTWGTAIYLPGLRVTNWKKTPRDGEEAKKMAETVVTRWEKGGRDE